MWLKSSLQPGFLREKRRRRRQLGFDFRKRSDHLMRVADKGVLSAGSVAEAAKSVNFGGTQGQGQMISWLQRFSGIIFEPVRLPGASCPLSVT